MVAYSPEEVAFYQSDVSTQPGDTDDVGDFEAIEGAILTRVHRLRERKHGFRSHLLRRVKREYGALLCEACHNGARVQGAIAQAIFEVHHLVPLFQVSTIATRLNDLVLLCANCHRLIHAAMREHKRHYGLADFRTWLSNGLP